MLPWLTAVVQNIDVGATSLFKGISQYRHVGEVSAVVDGLSQLRDCAFVPGKP
jgi:hypothetical protein